MCQIVATVERGACWRDMPSVGLFGGIGMCKVRVRWPWSNNALVAYGSHGEGRRESLPLHSRVQV